MEEADLLLADIGGTHARFMRAPASGPLPSPVVLKSADHASLEAAIGAFLGSAPLPLAGAAFAVAGPVTAEGAQLTNLGWHPTRASLAAATGVASPLLMNDFTALALGLPGLSAGDWRALGPLLQGELGAAVALLGPGTGLGVGGLLPDGRGGELPLSGEGGHVDLAATSAREWAVVTQLAATRAHVSAEAVLSGPGLAALYGALRAIDGLSPLERDAAAIAADASRDRLAAEAIALFTGWLGAVAGDLALTLGARGGVYLGGGILPRWGSAFDAGLFRRRFEAKGRFRNYLAAIPTRLVTAPDTAFRGLRRRLLSSF